MYSKILVPLDGSELSGCALEHAKAFATGCGASEVDLLYVVEPLSTTRVAFTTQEKEYWTQGDQKAEAWGKNYLAKVQQDLKKKGVAAKSVVLKGNPAEKILDYAKKNSVDLIILSSHGRSGPSRFAFGSVADRVVRLSSCPVIVIRPAACRVSA